MKLHLSVLALCLVLLFPSCKKKSVLDQNIEDYIKKNAHNPESYEPVSTTPVDTLTEIQYVQDEIKDKLSSIQADTTDLGRNKRMLSTDSSSLQLHREIQARHFKESGNLYAAVDSLEVASSIKDLNFWKEELRKSEIKLQGDKDELKKLEARLDSLNRASNKNSIYRFHFLHQFRGSVPLGGMMLKNAFIETDKDYNILTFDEQ